MNLTSDPMRISISENLASNSMVVIDILSKEVIRITKTMNRNVVVDFSALPNGVYELRVGIFMKFFIKE
jgi:hypothetical protein